MNLRASPIRHPTLLSVIKRVTEGSKARASPGLYDPHVEIWLRASVRGTIRRSMARWKSARAISHLKHRLG